MAKSKLSYTRTVTDKVSVKGTLSEDCTMITYLDEDDVAREIKITDCLVSFKGKEIDFSVSEKTNEELDVETETIPDEEAAHSETDIE